MLKIGFQACSSHFIPLPSSGVRSYQTLQVFENQSKIYLNSQKQRARISKGKTLNPLPGSAAIVLDGRLVRTAQFSGPLTPILQTLATVQKHISRTGIHRRLDFFGRPLISIPFGLMPFVRNLDSLYLAFHISSDMGTNIPKFISFKDSHQAAETSSP